MFTNESKIWAENFNGNKDFLFQPRRGSPFYSLCISGTWTSAVLEGSHTGKDGSWAPVYTVVSPIAVQVAFMPHYRLRVTGAVGLFASMEIVMPQDHQ